ncbi:MAG: Nramp family divalent metal transporter [Candidatus Berkelbacteria bacterium]|nr:Nramp family divalent metal transporter [Candidatus Berkelbacteria bacterium]
MRFFLARFKNLEGLKPKLANPHLFNFGFLLMIMGPGIITGVIDSDSGSIATYSSVGASYGYALLWVIVLTTIPLAIIQEMTTRMGAVTGRGLASLIRENFGIRITFYSLIALVLVNIANIVADFAGIAAGGEIFGISRFILLPTAVIVILYLVLAKNYRKIEKILLIFCLFYIAYIVAGILAHPNWTQALHGVILPSINLKDSIVITAVLALIGTTIAPWMPFYQQSAVAEKKIALSNYKYERIDTYTGSVMTQAIAFFIVLATAATLFKNGIVVNSASDAANALVPLVGKFAGALFALGIINAGFTAAIVLPTSTAYSLAEGFGWNSGMNKKFKEAPRFYAILIGTVIVSAITVLFLKVNLIKIMIFSQAINGFLLPVILILMLTIANNKKIMGKHVNTRVQNIIGILTICALVLLTISLIYFAIFGK